MAITTNAICNSFKKQLMGGEHDFDSGGDTFKLASNVCFYCYIRSIDY